MLCKIQLIDFEFFGKDKYLFYKKKTLLNAEMIIPYDVLALYQRQLNVEEAYIYSILKRASLTILYDAYNFEDMKMEREKKLPK